MSVCLSVGRLVGQSLDNLEFVTLEFAHLPEITLNDLQRNPGVDAHGC